MSDCNDMLASLKRFKEQHGKEYRLLSLGIFGSFARDEATENSDVDIVFETDEPNLFRAARLKEDIEALLSRHVDIVRLRERMNPRLKARIEREARYAR